MNIYPTKSSTEVLDYRADFTAWINQAPGDSATEVTVTTSPPGLVLGQLPVPEAFPTVWIGGGVSGTEYEVLWTLTTAAGRVKTETIVLVVD